MAPAAQRPLRGAPAHDGGVHRPHVPVLLLDQRPPAAALRLPHAPGCGHPLPAVDVRRLYELLRADHRGGLAAGWEGVPADARGGAAGQRRVLPGLHPLHRALPPALAGEHCPGLLARAVPAHVCLGQRGQHLSEHPRGHHHARRAAAVAPTGRGVVDAVGEPHLAVHADREAALPRGRARRLRGGLGRSRAAVPHGPRARFPFVEGPS